MYNDIVDFYINLISQANSRQDFRSPNGIYANGELFSEMAINNTKSKLDLQKSALSLRLKTLACKPTATYRFLINLRNNS